MNSEDSHSYIKCSSFYCRAQIQNQMLSPSWHKQKIIPFILKISLITLANNNRDASSASPEGPKKKKKQGLNYHKYEIWINPILWQLYAYGLLLSQPEQLETMTLFVPPELSTAQ